MKNKILVFFLLIIAVFFAVTYFYPPIRSHIPLYKKSRELYSVVMRNPLCSVPEGLRGIDHQTQFYNLLNTYKTKARLKQKDSGGFELWETPMGAFWIPPGLSLDILTYCLAEQKSDVYGTGPFGVQKGDIVLDCGANIGTYTKKALQAGAGLVVAIEPSPNNIECLRRNFKPEIEQGRVIVYEKGVWDHDDVLKFNVSATSTSDSFTNAVPWTEKTIAVPVTTIDNLVKELTLTRVDYIKMDIEGAESNALTGAKETIKKFAPRMAIGTEHTEDFLKNSTQVFNIVKGFNPNYKTKCGACDMDKNGYIAPESLLFF